MTRKRSRLEIYVDVLKTVKSGVNRPTNIMYKCNLSWLPLREILESLISQGLIEAIDKGNRRVYEITEKGREVLSYFKKTEDLLVLQERHR